MVSSRESRLTEENIVLKKRVNDLEIEIESIKVKVYNMGAVAVPRAAEVAKITNVPTGNTPPDPATVGGV